LPQGAELTGLKKGRLPVAGKDGGFKGKKLDLRKVTASPEILLEATLSYLHAPYQWGGRTSAGIDCSGLVQMAFKICGIPVLRDAAQQANLGSEVHFLAESRAGDIAFFDNAEGRIVHVGILADKHTIIHATDTAGRVVEDRIDNAGIISISLKKRTHKLRTIRRFPL
jgi:cell wall-associated NlpC family hydrolase